MQPRQVLDQLPTQRRQQVIGKTGPARSPGSVVGAGSSLATFAIRSSGRDGDRSHRPCRAEQLFQRSQRLLAAQTRDGIDELQARLDRIQRGRRWRCKIVQHQHPQA